MLRKHQHLMLMIHLFIYPFIFGRRKQRNILCNSHNVCAAINTLWLGDAASVYVGQHEHVCVWKHCGVIYARQHEQMMFGSAASGLLSKKNYRMMRDDS